MSNRFHILIIFLFTLQLIETQQVLTIYASEFEDQIKNFEYLMINFYVESCSFSSSFFSEYNLLAQTLQKNKFKIELAKVNIAGQSSLIKKYDLRGTPTVILLKNGNYIDTFYGEKKVRDIQTWIFNKMNEKLLNLTNAEEIDETYNRFSISCILFGNAEKCSDVNFHSLASKFDDIVFAHCDSAFCFKSFNIQQCDVMLLKHIDSKNEIYQYNKESISLIEWIQLNKLPLVIDFNQYSSSLVFSALNPAIFLFRDKEILAEKSIELEFEMLQVAKKFKVIFSITLGKIKIYF